LKKAVADNVFAYVSKRAKIFPKFTKGGLTPVLVVDELFCYWLFEIILKLQVEGASASLCPCGCGRPVPPGRTFASPACRTKMKNAKPARQVKAWLRTLKNRGRIEESVYEKLCRRVDSLAGRGWGKEEIRADIEGRLSG